MGDELLRISSAIGASAQLIGGEAGRVVDGPWVDALVSYWFWLLPSRDETRRSTGGRECPCSSLGGPRRVLVVLAGSPVVVVVVVVGGVAAAAAGRRPAAREEPGSFAASSSRVSEGGSAARRLNRLSRRWLPDPVAVWGGRVRELAFIGGRPPGRAACCCCDGGAKVRMFFRLGFLWKVGGEAAPVGCASPGRAVAIAPRSWSPPPLSCFLLHEGAFLSPLMQVSCLL